MGVGAADRPVACLFAETEFSGQPLKVARGMPWGQATTDPRSEDARGPGAAASRSQWGDGLRCKPLLQGSSCTWKLTSIYPVYLKLWHMLL